MYQLTQNPKMGPSLLNNSFALWRDKTGSLPQWQELTTRLQMHILQASRQRLQFEAACFWLQDKLTTEVLSVQRLASWLGVCPCFPSQYGRSSTQIA